MVKILTSVFHFRAFLLQFLINQKIRDPAPGCPLLPAVFFFLFLFFFPVGPSTHLFPSMPCGWWSAESGRGVLPSRPRGVVRASPRRGPRRGGRRPVSERSYRLSAAVVRFASFPEDGGPFVRVRGPQHWGGDPLPERYGRENLGSGSRWRRPRPSRGR